MNFPVLNINAYLQFADIIIVHICVQTLFTYNLKLETLILTTLVYSAELLTDFSYTNFTVSTEMHWTNSVFTWKCSKLLQFGYLLILVICTSMITDRMEDLSHEK